MNAQTYDVLILGATGVTGRRATKYLATHKEVKSISWAIAGRSLPKLKQLHHDLSLPDAVGIIEVDVQNYEQVVGTVTQAKIILNTVGPYWTYGIPVAEACAKHGVHCLDLTGEPLYVDAIVQQFHDVAARTGALIVPACGFDSIPSDMSVHLARKTLGDHSSEPDLGLESAVTAFEIDGGFPGGTVASAVAFLEDVPEHLKPRAMEDHLLGPRRGKPSPQDKMIWNLVDPSTNESFVGTYFVMRPINRAIIHRTWGLLESDKDSKRRYGADFTYDEFWALPNTLLAVIAGYGLFLTMVALRLALVRRIAKHFFARPGEGPRDEDLSKGFFRTTNIAKSTVSEKHPEPVTIKTTIYAEGDPACFATLVMAIECVLALALEARDLPHQGKRGGVLTPMSAFGDVIVNRLRNSGVFQIQSEVIS